MSSNIWNATEQKLEQVSGNVNINDSITSADSTWSSEKINDSLVDIIEDEIVLTDFIKARLGTVTNKVIRVGNVKSLILQLGVGASSYGAQPANTSIDLGTIPEDFRPTYNYSKDLLIREGGVKANLLIKTDGNILVTVKQDAQWSYMTIYLAETYI